MREVFAIARRARAHGNRPFGAMLVAGNGAVLAVAENSQITRRAGPRARRDESAAPRRQGLHARRARDLDAVYERRAVRDVRRRDFLERHQPAGVRPERRSAASAFGILRRRCWSPARATCSRGPAALLRSSAPSRIGGRGDFQGRGVLILTTPRTALTTYNRVRKETTVLISPELAKAFNAQIGHEFGASLQYLAIAAHFSRRGRSRCSPSCSRHRPKKRSSTR